MQRGNDRMDIFRCDSDYRVFLAMMREAAERCESDVHGYVLMKTHVHFLMTPKAATSIERTMQVVGTRYVRYFNRRYDRSGHLFQGPYDSIVVDDERYWITCLRYIELNPVRARIVATPDQYCWSSYAANALGHHDGLVRPHPRYLELGPDLEECRRAWGVMCAASLTSEELDRIRFAIFENRVNRGLQSSRSCGLVSGAG